MATHFPGLRQQWRDNCEEERLLGVDINGQLDSPVSQDPQVQEQMRAVAVEVNRATAATLGINASVAVTCVKPSGNSSQLFDCSPGIHTRWAPYYVRNVRVGAHTPIYKVLRDVGVPMDPENGQTPEDANTWVIHFPVKAPEGAVTRNDRSAIQQCEYWLQNKTRWTEHNPSVTITYHPDEVLDIIKWTWEHRDIIGGMTFLPAFDALYAQMPYIEITAEEYQRLAPAFPVIDFSKLYYYRIRRPDHCRPRAGLPGRLVRGGLRGGAAAVADYFDGKQTAAGTARGRFIAAPFLLQTSSFILSTASRSILLIPATISLN